MSGLPSGSVMLEDSTGAFTVDVSSRVELQEGVTVSGFGRADEMSTAQASTLTLTLDNTDGALSAGSGWDTTPWDSGPWGGAGLIYRDQRIRLSLTKGATTRQRFTGTITELAQVWPGGSQAYSTVQVTAVDLLADLSRRTMRSMLEEEVLLRSPARYYTLSEAEGATSAGDSSGNEATPLAVTGTGPAMTFGQGVGPVDGLSAAQFAGALGLGGQYLSDGSFTSFSSPTVFSLMAIFATSDTSGRSMGIAVGPGCYLYVDSSGFLNAGAIAGGTGLFGSKVNDGATHRAYAVSDGTTFSLYLDDSLAATGAAPSSAVVSTDFRIGAAPGVGTTFNGTISHVASFTDALTAFEVGQIDGAASGATESVHNRMQRFAGYGDVIVNMVGLTDDPTGSGPGRLVGAQQTSGGSLLDAMMTVALAEDGALFANTDGTLLLTGGSYRASKTTPDLTLPSDDVSADVAVTSDTQQKITQVTVTRTGGATQVVGDDDDYPESVELIVATDDAAKIAAQWIVAKHSDPGPRMGAVTFDLLTSPNAESMLAMNLADRVTFTSMPSQLLAGAGDVTVEGWSETVSDTSWTITANVLPWSLFTALILDDLTYGVLDAYPIAG